MNNLIEEENYGNPKFINNLSLSFSSLLLAIGHLAETDKHHQKKKIILQQKLDMLIIQLADSPKTSSDAQQVIKHIKIFKEIFKSPNNIL